MIIIINIINCLIYFSISILFYNNIKNKINSYNIVIDYLKNELVKNNNYYIELTNEKYKNVCLNTKLKSQLKKLEEQIEKNNKYHNIIIAFKNKKKQDFFKNKSEIFKQTSKKIAFRRYYSCNNLNIL